MWLDRPLSATFLFLNMLSRSVITFLPRSKCLLVSWLHSPSAVILEPKKGKTVTISIVSLFAMKWWCLMPRSSFFKCWVLSQLFHSPLSRSSKGSNSLLSATGNLNYSLCFIQPYNSDFLIGVYSKIKQKSNMWSFFGLEKQISMKLYVCDNEYPCS